MKKTNKLWLALLLTVLVAALLAVGFTAAAEGETPEIVESGYCGGEGDGTNLTWTLDSEGTLTISGTGAMREYAFTSRNDIINVSLPNGLTTIGALAFYDCRALTNITIPDGVTIIDQEAFSGCWALTGVSIPNSVTSIRDNAFEGCKSLTGITIPDGVTSISSGVFLACYGLTNVTIPNSVTYIDEDAFRACRGLLSITIPNSVTGIGAYAFQDCDSLRDVTIPCSMTSISKYTFFDCPSLTTITIPDSVTSIEYNAFGRCENLNDVFYAGSKEQWNAVSIGDLNTCLKEATIHYNCQYEHTAAAPVRENETAATCTAAGSYDEVVYCTGCGYEFSRETKTVDAIGHTWGEWEVIQQATTEETGLMRRVCQNDPSHVEERVIPKLELDENNEPTSAIQAFIDSITSFFRGIIDWFLRLFKWLG